MKTLKRGFTKRALSMLLSLLMMLSICTVGFVSVSAADIDLAKTGATITGGTVFYLKPNDGWKSDGARFAVYFCNGTSAAVWCDMTAVSGETDLYSVTVPANGSHANIIFCRMNGTTTENNWDNKWNQTGDLVYDGKNNLFTITDWGAGTWSVYTPAFTNSFFADVDGKIATTYDRINPVGGKLYLPSAKVTLFASEGSFTIGNYTVDTNGKEVNLESNTYTLGGDASGTITVLRSANVSSIHTVTEESVPQGLYYPQKFDDEEKYHKDQYESENDSKDTGSDTQFIAVYNKDGVKLNTKSNVLKKIKGRGNSSWKASCTQIGKYAFNLTLDKKAPLLDESEASKKYCLVSYNADEARMRNAVVYELSQQIGIEYVADYAPVDFYNNGQYIGSYLLTDKVEIGDPLVNLTDADGNEVNLDDENELFGSVLDEKGKVVTPGKNYNIYDAKDISDYRRYVNGSKTTNSTPGFYKYVALDEIPSSVYEDSGFLLEFELYERFADEISGFISTRGQQIVCKYPEYASKQQIEFIMEVWNEAEALIYREINGGTPATYNELDAVIDVESFAKMYLIQELTKNLDGGATSYYVYYDGGKLHAGVSWDYDWTLGQYEKEQTSKINSNSKFISNVDKGADFTFDNYYGWYINSKNIYGGSVFNAQAALCQNEAFWSVVVAEWDELFYSEASKFPVTSWTSGSDLELPVVSTGIIGDFYNMIAASTAMDEDKWGLIAKDPLDKDHANWGSTDTGDTHEAAVKFLNDWFYDRLNWMDSYISRDGASHTGIYNVDYVIQPPTVSVDKTSYAAGDTVTLTIEDKTDGDYYYEIFKNGTMWQTSTTETYTFTADTKGTTEYTVYAVSNNSKKMSAASNVAAVNVDGFNFSLDVTAPKSVMVGDIIHIESKTNSEEEVTFNLYKGESLVDANKTGEFFIETFASDANTAPSYKLVATTTVDNELFTKEFDFTVTINPFEFNVKLTAPESVEAGMVVTLKANAVSNTTVKYKFFKADGTPVAENSAGTYSFDATRDDIGKTLSFYVVAATTVAGTEYTSTSPKVNIQVTEVKEVMDVTIYFKSTSTLGYRPIINTSGAVQNLVDYSMEKSELIASKNISQTSTFWWYKAEVQVSKASPSLSVNVLSSRYAMEGDIILNITQPGAVYLGIDNLNTGSEMIDMTQWDEDARNWTKSAVHSIYDAEKDGKESLSALSANINLTSVGDANGDGKVNIKDVTLIQKFLANLETLGAIGKEVSDVNSDSRVTIKDATAIQKKIAGCL